MALDSRTHLQSGTKTQTHYVTVPSADLRIGTQMGTQALYGQRFDVIDTQDGRSRGALRSILPSSDRIDYIGEIRSASLSTKPLIPTYRVSALSAAIFETADIKSPLLGFLPRNAVVEGVFDAGFLKLGQGGFIHSRHLSGVYEAAERGFTELASDMLGLPYIWGGTGWVGVDCTGLVQSALAATGVDAPRDADQQEHGLGHAVDFAERRSGDLLFWSGHVGIVVEGDQLLHANAHHMCVAREPVDVAVSRIGAVRSVKRLSGSIGA